MGLWDSITTSTARVADWGTSTWNSVNGLGSQMWDYLSGNKSSSQLLSEDANQQVYTTNDGKNIVQWTTPGWIGPHQLSGPPSPKLIANDVPKITDSVVKKVTVSNPLPSSTQHVYDANSTAGNLIQGSSNAISNIFSELGKGLDYLVAGGESTVNGIKTGKTSTKSTSFFTYLIVGVVGLLLVKKVF